MSLKKIIVKNNETIEERFEKIEKNNVFVKKILFDSIVFSPFVHLKCQNCGMYRRNYHCLCMIPWNKQKERLSKFKNSYLIYIKVDNKSRIEHLKLKNEENIKNNKKTLNDWNLHKFACNANQVVVVNRLKKIMIEISENFNTKNMLLLNGGGGCRGCKVCGLVKEHITGEKQTPCKKPKESFTSPEALGIDVYATLKNNNIEFDVIPKLNLICVGMVMF